jgi:hypothetical protein
MNNSLALENFSEHPLEFTCNVHFTKEWGSLFTFEADLYFILHQLLVNHHNKSQSFKIYSQVRSTRKWENTRTVSDHMCRPMKAITRQKIFNLKTFVNAPEFELLFNPVKSQ